MPLDLKKTQEEIAAAPIHSPFPLEVAVAVVGDCFRMAERAPVDDSLWEKWEKKPRKLWAEQMGILAHFLSSTSLRETTVEALRKGKDRRDALDDFFARVEPLTAEMIRANAFRQEEFLRCWADWCGTGIRGETPAESRRRLEQLDYRKALEEFGKAKTARKKEDAARLKALKEAEEREAAARGWRE
ncbi:MAG: hypothetical protein MUC63_07330 [Planctomycetes bacterium]|nr:hypothetical protein [Planctomycetota bacterium]